MDHTEHTALASLAELVKKQRRTVAAQIRISAEDRELRKRMRELLDVAGVESVTCEDYTVRHALARDGSPTVRIDAIAAPPTTTG